MPQTLETSGAPLTAAPKTKFTLFRVALSVSLLTPIVGFLLLLLAFAIGNRPSLGAGGLGVFVAGLVVFTFAILLGGLLLLITGLTAIIARKQRADAGDEKASARARRTEKAGYTSVLVSAAAPLALVLAAALGAAVLGAIGYATTPNQNKSAVEEVMAKSLSEAGYTTLPGYQKTTSEIATAARERKYAPTTYATTATVNYTDVKAIAAAQERLVQAGWRCQSVATAPVAQAEALAATGSKTPNVACTKAGREVLTFVYTSPKSAVLKASTGEELTDFAAPTDANWCEDYIRLQTGAVAKSCRVILGRETPEELAARYGMSKECYDQVRLGADFDPKTKVTKRCLEELKEARQRLQEDRDRATGETGQSY